MSGLIAAGRLQRLVGRRGPTEKDMSLFCDAGYDDTDGADWWWYQPADEAPLATKRSRKCCSCGAKVSPGDTARKIRRYRPPTEFEEMRGIACDEVQLADWYLCETCGDLADSISELGFCYNLGDESLADQIAEYRREEAAAHERLATPNVEFSGGAPLHGAASAGTQGSASSANNGGQNDDLQPM